MIEINGKSGIVVKVLADSVSEAGSRLTTYELTYPRIIHSELLTHKMLCSNSASSRAIPFKKMAEQLTGKPVRFGEANPGMQDKGECFNKLIPLDVWDETEGWIIQNFTPEEAWDKAKNFSLSISESFHKAGYHKQVFNRLTEASQMMKTVISGTEWANYFWLRNDSAADPTLHELARCMFEAREQSVPQLLKAGEWHLSYVNQVRMSNGTQEFFVVILDDTVGLTLEQAIKVSCARTAAVSFRNEDYGLEKCLEVYDRLIGDERKHSSAMQHAATPMNPMSEWKDWGVTYGLNNPSNVDTWEPGVSHATRDGKLWSAQYCGWIMHRKTIVGENYIG
jgi:hypothetical protein